MLKKMVLILFLFVMSYTLSTCKNAFSALSEPVEEMDYHRIYLPRTGQTKCYQGVTPGAEIPCAGTGQDGEYQRGVTWPNPRFRDNGNGTVTDRLTGLIWVKNGNLMASRDPGFDTDGTAGDGKVTWQHALDYVAKLNQELYLGYSDWRLPNINELASLADYGQTNLAASLNSQGFTSIQGDWYFSATTRPDTTVSAFVMHLSFPSIGIFGKTSYAYILAVRGNGSAGAISIAKTGQTTCYDSSGSIISCAGTGQDGEYQRGVTLPNPRFRENGNGTVTDRLTGLMWQQNGNASGTRNWQNALNYVKTLNIGGYSDWRLPNINELASLRDYGQSNHTVWLNSQGFISIQPIQYWSSSTAAGLTSRAWYCYGFPKDADDKSNSYYVLAVRSGQ